MESFRRSHVELSQKTSRSIDAEFNFCQKENGKRS